MDTGSEKGCSEDRLDDSLESSEAGSDWVEEIPLELEGLMECQSLETDKSIEIRNFKQIFIILNNSNDYF